MCMKQFLSNSVYLDISSFARLILFTLSFHVLWVILFFKHNGCYSVQGSSLSAMNMNSSSMLQFIMMDMNSTEHMHVRTELHYLICVTSVTASHRFSWHLQTAVLLFSLAKYPKSAFLSPATLPHHLRTHPLLLPLPLISQSSPLPQNPKSTRSCPTVQTSNLTQIRSPPGFLKNVHPFLFPQSPILSTSPSSLVSFIPLSKNPLSHHCLRNRHWIKKNSQTIGQSVICLSFPK